jgi:hypothetical protein
MPAIQCGDVSAKISEIGSVDPQDTWNAIH